MNKKKRALEALKNLLIVLLSVSALLLVADSRLLGHLPGAEQPREEHVESGGPVETIRGQVTLPLALAAINREGCYGVQHSKQQVSGLFEQLAPILAEALSGAGTPRAATPEQWRQHMTEGPGLWLDLQGQVPLGVLARWLTGEEHSGLNACVEQLLLCVAEGQQVCLYYQDVTDGRFYVCDVELVSASYLTNTLEQFPDNGACFAMQVPGLEALQDHMLVMAHIPQPGEYVWTEPMHTDEQARTDLLLEQLSFPVEITTVYDTPEGKRARSGNDTLTISDGGGISYESTREEGRYPVESGDGVDPEFAAVDGARQLVCTVLEQWSGAGGLYLSKVEKPEPDCWRVEFRYELDGIPALVGNKGYAASVLVEQGYITQYEMQLRSFVPLGSQTTPVLPLRQAAAVMADLERDGGQLRLCYQESGDTLRAGWVVE